MKYISLPIILLTLIISIQSLAQKTEHGNFYLQHYLKNNGDSDVPVGLFVKGNLSEIQNQLESRNGLYRGSVKGWHYIRIASNKLEGMIQEKCITSVNFRTYQGHPMNDTMRVNNRINPVHSGQAPLDTAYTGQGVLMGYIDTGIDWKHPDFMHPDSSTRILYIWDQTRPVNGDTPAEYGYGQHWDSAAINLDIPNHSDQWGHGTTVAGAGSGNAFANGTHKGVAPNTDIVMVESNFSAPDWLATIVDATEYIYHIADSIGKPCVINASVGTYLGSHDGLDPYALYIDSLINDKRGRLYVASAGNSGAWGNYHLHTDVATDTSFTWFKINPSSAFGGSAGFLELWADTADFNNVYFGMGADKITPAHEFRARGNFFNVQPNLNTLVHDTIRNSNNDILATIQYWTELRDGQYLVQAYLPTPDSNQYFYRFETYGTGNFNVWSHLGFGISHMEDRADTILPASELAHYVFPDSLQTIVSSFQCSPHVITVGNYVNDSGYVNKFNNWLPNGLNRGEIDAGSSRGPARTGLIKPDVCASGATTVSAYPMNLIDDINANAPQDTLLGYGGLHASNGGTSMSSPVVAGIAALYLEKCPKATSDEFKNAITSNTYSDGYTGILPNPSYGYGKADGLNTLIHSNFTPSYSGNNAICENDSTLITILGNNEYFLWQNGDTTINQYFSDSIDTYVTTIDSSGCSSDTLFISLFEPTPPTVNCITSNYYFCENDSLSIAVTGFFDSIEWGDGSTENPRTFTTPFNGYIIGIDNYGCTTDSLCVVNVIENPLPTTPTINASLDTLSTDGGMAFYQWYLDGNPIAGANSETHIATQNGTYTVEVTDINSCSSISTNFDFNSVGIHNSEINHSSVFPNPNNGSFSITANHPNWNLKVFDGIGKLIQVENNLTSTALISVKDLEAGTYYIQVVMDGTTDIHKIVVLE